MDAEARIAMLERQVETLRDQIAALEAQLGHDIEPSVALGLTASEARVFGTLMRRGEVTKQQIMGAIYADRVHDDELPEPRIVDVFVCKIRKKLARYGIEITTIWGQGYGLSAPARERAMQLCRRRDTQQERS